MAFIARLGGMLVEPRATLERTLREGRGGLGDFVALLGLQVLAAQLVVLVRALWTIFAVSYSGGISLLLHTVAESVFEPVVAVFFGTLVMGWLARGRPGRARGLDLVALCVVPAIFLRLLVALVAGLAGWPPSRWAVIGMSSAGGLWFVALLALAVSLVRRWTSAPEGTP